MPRPICNRCRCELFPKQNGYVVHIKQANGQPYQIRQGDLWECPSCTNRIVTGFGEGPIAEHHNREEFAAYVPTVQLEVPA